jgi:Transglutaminase-like superfamily
MGFMRHLFISGILLSHILTHLFGETPPPLLDEWLQVRLQGQPIGYSSRIVRSYPERGKILYRTETEQVIKFKRLGAELELRTRSRVIEDAAGVVLNFEQRREQGEVPVITRGYREGENMVVFYRGQEQTFPLVSTALGPYAQELRKRQIILQPGTTQSAIFFSEDHPQKVVRAQTTVEGQQTIEGLSSEEPLWCLRQNLDVLAGLEIKTWVNVRGETKRMLVPFGGLGELEMIASPREVALQPISGKEVMRPSLIVPSQPLLSVKTLGEARYFITGAGPLRPPEGREQRVLQDTLGGTQIVVQRAAFNEEAITWQIPATMMPHLAPYLAATPYLEVDDAQVQLLARELIGTERHPLRAARRIEAFVREFITKKDLSVGFASAAEVARLPVGDCTEHAVLVAALGRAVGLPTRLVAGLAYLPPPPMDTRSNSNPSPSAPDYGVFGFHLWAEAYLGPDLWIPLDASLGGFDVGHIALLKTALDEQGPSPNPNSALFLPLMQLMGRLRIEVLRYE